MKIHQFSCREENGVDHRQADAILRHNPDVIFWEAPSTGRKASLVFDPKKSPKKHEGQLKKITKSLQKVSKKYPWVVSDISVYKNAIELLKNGHRVRIYNVDAPSELLKETIINKWNMMERPRRRGSHLLWWIYIYLRERIMTRNIQPLLKGDRQTALMFLQKFHWLNVKFLLSNPTKDDIWRYYFGKFKNINKQNVSEIIKEKNKVLYKYWLRHSDFI